MLVNGAVAHAASKLSWDGTWAGTLNNEPVSVTIAEGKVVGYTIRGFSPLPIESASVSGRSVSLVIGAAYRVTITEQSERDAWASLTARWAIASRHSSAVALPRSLAPSEAAAGFDGGSGDSGSV